MKFLRLDSASVLQVEYTQLGPIYILKKVSLLRSIVIIIIIDLYINNKYLNWVIIVIIINTQTFNFEAKKYVNTGLFWIITRFIGWIVN
jgi:hypothetical protein